MTERIDGIALAPSFHLCKLFKNDGHSKDHTAPLLRYAIETKRILVATYDSAEYRQLESARMT